MLVYAQVFVCLLCMCECIWFPFLVMLVVDACMQVVDFFLIGVLASRRVLYYRDLPEEQKRFCEKAKLTPEETLAIFLYTGRIVVLCTWCSRGCCLHRHNH